MWCKTGQDADKSFGMSGWKRWMDAAAGPVTAHLGVNLSRRCRMSAEVFANVHYREDRVVSGWWRRMVLGVALAGTTWGAGSMAWGQLPMPGSQPQTPNPLTDVTASPGTVLLYKLDAEFAKAVATNGGAGFASWFADDGMVLGNGKAPVVGKVAIAQSADWSPKDYQLTWKATGAWMNPSGDTGYTWGNYTGQSMEAQGNPVTTSGRYITLWNKQTDGNWKVELEASSDAPVESGGNCCRLPGVGSSGSQP